MAENEEKVLTQCEGEAKQSSKGKFNKKLMLGIVAGILLIAIAGIAVTLKVNPRFLRGTTDDYQKFYRAFSSELSVNSLVAMGTDLCLKNELMLLPGTVKEGDRVKRDEKTSGKSPVDGYAYYISTEGVLPEGNGGAYYGATPKNDNYEANVDGIKYYQKLWEPAEGFVGEILLGKNVADLDISWMLLPCDGRELQIGQYQLLYVIIGNQYGGDGAKTFKLPNLSSAVPPIPGAKYYIRTEGSFLQVSKTYIPSVTPTPIGVATPAATPTEVPKPLVEPDIYRMFLNDMLLEDGTIDSPDRILSEFIIAPNAFRAKDFAKCDGKGYMIGSNQPLYAILGNAFGGNISRDFMVPEFTNKLQLNDIDYYICTDGTFPTFKRSYPATSDDKIKYYPRKGLGDEFYIGEIKLAKNVDESAPNNALLLCDGRELKMEQYQPIYTLVENKFGGDGRTTFRLPDMTTLPSPVEGAKYYITFKGIFPQSN